MADYDIEFEEQEFNAQFTGTTTTRVIGLIKPHWKATLTFLAAVGLVSATDAVLTYINKLMIDNGIAVKNWDALIEYASYYGGIILAQSFFVFGFIYTAATLGERVRYDLRKSLFNHLQDLSLSYFNQNPVGWLIARVTSDTERVADMVTWGFLDATWATMNIITSLAFMFWINWQLGLIVMLIVPLLVVIAAKFQVAILKEYRNTRKFNSKITASFNENIMGVRVVKALNREDENMREFGELTGSMYRASYRAAWLSALFLPVVQMISALALGVIVYYGGVQSQYGGMTIGGIHAFVSYLTFMMWPIQDLARVYSEIQHAIASAERIFSLQDRDPEIKDREGAIDPGSIRGDIEFEHVDFTYEDEKPVLTDFTLNVKAGEMIALVGPTGGGKSTIVNLLCRFFEPKRGAIRIHGRDYMDYTLHAIQSRVGIVLQTPHLFSGTIRENLRYGRLDATDDEIVEAAKLAGAHDFIVTFEKGYDSEVGEGGNLLSTGQKQLISLARAVLARPEIFIMDEATSSVDTLTEALIQRGMEHLMQGRTSFVIAHRLSTIKRASRIVVIENGRIAEMGTHAELLKQRGHYYNLYTKQFRHEREVQYGGVLDEASVPAVAD
jgi:ATP-binding cassette subfamily B protein